MKIIKIKTWVENLKLTKPYSIAYETISSVENIFVYIELANGVGGIGSGSPYMAVTGETMSMCKEALDQQLEKLVLGQDIHSLGMICQSFIKPFSKTPAASAAIDIALHDAWSKLQKKPLADALGRCYYSLPTSITIGIKSIKDAQLEAQEYIDSGFSYPQGKNRKRC